MKKDSILWKIEKKGKRPSFLFGTMHVNHKAMPLVVEWVAPFIEQCAVYAAEMNFHEQEAASESDMPSLSAPISLDTLLGKNKWKELNFWLEKKINLPATLFKTYYPIQVIGILASTSFEAGPSLDKQLFDYAQAQGISTTGLESYQEQLSVMTSMPLEAQLAYLKKILKSFGTNHNKEDRLMAYYLQGASHKLYKQVKRSSGGLRKILLYDRNERMAARFAEYYSKMPIFASVGAAHLQGGKGMLRYLKHRGFSVKPIPTPAFE